MKKDPTAESRKEDHIQLAFDAQVLHGMMDNRFYYEPMLSGHPTEEQAIGVNFLGYDLETPIWVSSMTGGTEKAKRINENLARACGEYGMGMGLGSCRALLDDDARLSDFDVRSYMPGQPLYANLGIAQVEELVTSNSYDNIDELIKKLQADGLIIHVNPLQEWLQPEGDTYHTAPLDTIKRVIDNLPSLKIIVKEVGQGMGPKSLKALYELPLAAIDFAAAGGTNFSKLELHRADEMSTANYSNITRIGHTSEEMVQLFNSFHNSDYACQETIISGGVRDFLDGYYHTSKLNGKSIYGQASAFLKHAMGDYEQLQAHVESQIKGLQLANALLTIK